MSTSTKKLTYQEIRTRLTKCESRLEDLKSTKFLNDVNQKEVQKLTILKESLENKLNEMDKGIVHTDDDREAVKLAKSGVDVKLTKEQEGIEFSKSETIAIAKEVGKALAKALKSYGDEINSMKIVKPEPNSFDIKVVYKNGSEDRFSFYIVDDTLHLVDFSFDKELVEIGVKPSGEAIVHVDVLANELMKHFKSLNEIMTDQEFADAKEKERLDKHPEKKTIKKIQALVRAEKAKQADKDLEEIDLNDPVMVSLRARKDQDQKSKLTAPKGSPSKKTVSRKTAQQLKALEKRREELMFGMEQEAEPEGGSVADEYGRELDRIDRAIRKLKSKEGLTNEGSWNIMPVNKLQKAKRFITDKISEKQYDKLIKRYDSDENILTQYFNHTKQGNNAFNDDVKYEKIIKTPNGWDHLTQAIDNDELSATHTFRSLKDYIIFLIRERRTPVRAEKDKQRLEENEPHDQGGDLDIGHQDDEPDMLKQYAYDIAQYAAKLYKQLDKYDKMDAEVDFPNWWQSKVILSREYISKAQHYLEFEEKQPIIDTLALEGNDWGSSDNFIFNQFIHKALGEPTKMPSPFDTKLEDAVEDAVDFYWYDWEEYDNNRERLLMKAKRNYLRAYFKDTFERMTQMFSESVNEVKTYKKGDKLKIKLKNGKKFDVIFDAYAKQKGVAFGKFKDGSGEYDTKPFSLDSIVESVNEESHAKLQKKHSDVVSKMKELAKQYKAGDKSVVDQLKDLTTTKKKLEADIEKAVSGIGVGQEFDDSVEELKTLTELSGDQREAIMDLQNILDQASRLGDEAREIVRQSFPNMLSKADAYGAFEFGYSANRYDTTLESIIEEIEEYYYEEEDLDESKEKEGQMAASKGKKYSENPYEKGTKDHLEWSKGHNSSRARKLSLKEGATCCGRCGRVHVKGTECKRPFLKGKDHCRFN